jgi:hypothetical protein
MTTTCEHPLHAALGCEWRWFHDPRQQATLILHPTGLHFYLSDAMVMAGNLGKIWPVMAAACVEAVTIGLVGRCEIEVTTPAYELVVADPIAEAREPGSGSARLCVAPWTARLVKVKP